MDCVQNLASCGDMRFFDIVFFLLYIVGFVLSKKDCPKQCDKTYNPVCGMVADKHGHWTKKIFKNECKMRNKNKCEKGKYIPCDSDLEPEEL
ncbi:unnamed protein product [Nezara viridula]|uniref:Kazal-like domain-containing protein n=1 Tax=Nezara viridula TaxID=85310 RepID=A0A9P0MZ44_NEZVI|nr:unnamed protein product [Nezara viridula]